eukprot:5848909-Heterocapsa_arctica.AAC.1
MGAPVGIAVARELAQKVRQGLLRAVDLEQAAEGNALHPALPGALDRATRPLGTSANVRPRDVEQ